MPPEPAACLASDRLGELLAYARQHYDAVLLVLPPPSKNSDAALPARWLTGYAPLVTMENTRFWDITQSLDTLENAGARICGWILQAASDSGAEKKLKDFKNQQDAIL